MNKRILARALVVSGAVFLFLFSDIASAYWIWTPGTKKFINPKNAVKDSPKEQFDWAMSFYNAKDYQRATVEFEKLAKQYEYSEYASRAQYHVGLCYENINKPYIAFQNYQKAIDSFPHIENIDEIVAREFNIANMFASKASPKVMGTDIMTSADRAIEIYKKVVENAPYGRLADQAQYNMGVAMKKSELFDEAIQAFQKIVDDYPTSPYVDKAKFEVADCAYKASLKPAYDVEPTNKAIRAFEDFTRENRDRSLSREADKTIQRLRDRAAEKSLLTAQFYEKIGRLQAAIIYYNDVITSYPDSSFVNLSRNKVESLTAALQKPKAKMAPLNFSKPSGGSADMPKKESVAAVSSGRKGWSLFGLGGKEKAKPDEAVKEKPKKSAGWNLFGIGKPAKPKEQKAPKETVKKDKSWMPLKLNWPAPKSKSRSVSPAVEAAPAAEPAPVKEPEPVPAKEETVSAPAVVEQGAAEVKPEPEMAIVTPRKETEDTWSAEDENPDDQIEVSEY